MKIFICYFSGTGNTWWLLNEFKKLAAKDAHEVELFHVQRIASLDWSALEKLWKQADIIGIAHPIYGSNAPRLMKDFLTLLPKKIDIDNSPIKPGFIFTTMVFFSGDGGFALHKYLKAANVNIKIIHNFKMTSNLGIPVITYNPAHSKRFEKRKQRTLKHLNRVYCKLLKGKIRWQNKYNPFGYIFGWLQRLSMRSIEHENSKYLGVNLEKCARCLQCVKNCPTESIVFDEHQFTFLENCTACYRCYNFCPSQAITVFKRTANPKRHRQHKTFKKEKFF